MTVPAFSVLREGEEQRAIDVLVTAFNADPVIRWMYPDATSYLARFQAFLRALGGKAFTSHTVWRLGDFEAVALWFPPHVEPDGDAVIAEVTQSVTQGQHKDLFAVLEQMDAGHPTFPHWYLPWFGVESARQGKGIGGELMRNCLGVVDQDHLPAYLESPNPRNITFYERHGFEVTGVSQAGYTTGRSRAHNVGALKLADLPAVASHQLRHSPAWGQRKAKMRAFAIDGFGQVGSIRELPDPAPGEGEVLVRVRAAGVSTTDIAVIAGMLKDYFEHRFPLVPGIDASGIVERVGPGVDGYQEGDEVYGYVRRPVMGLGTLAERVALPVSGIERKPPSLSHEQASIIAHASLTAAAAVDAAAPGRGDRMVILGATGGVGSYATQLATAGGAHVIAVTLDDYAEYARALGAAEVIDYTATEPVEAIRERYPAGIDALIDLVGIPELSSGLAGLVHSGGRVVSVIMPPDVEGLAARGVEGILASRMAAEHRFPELAAQIAQGDIKLPAIQTFSFEEVGAALELQATRHVKGKLAVVLG